MGPKSEDFKAGAARPRMRKGPNQNGGGGSKAGFQCNSKMCLGLGFLFLMCGSGIMSAIMFLADQLSGGEDAKGGYKRPVSAGGGTNNANVKLEILDVSDHSEENVELLKEVLLSGKAYMLHCVDFKPDGKSSLPSIMGEVLEAMRNASGKDVSLRKGKVFQADCLKGKLPTGKTISERFNFGRKSGFLAVFGGDVYENPPFMLNYLNQAKFVLGQVKTRWGKAVGGANSKDINKVSKVTYLKDFNGPFEKKERSIVVLGNTEVKRKAGIEEVKHAIKAYKEEVTAGVSPGIKLWTVDNGAQQLSLGSEFKKKAPKLEEEEKKKFGRAICVVRTRDQSNLKKLDALGEEIREKKTKDPTKSSTTFYKGLHLKNWTTAGLADFVKACAVASSSADLLLLEVEAGFLRLPGLPKLGGVQKKAKVVKARSPEQEKKEQDAAAEWRKKTKRTKPK